MVNATVTGTRASHHLDMLRGGAAVAVLLYHIRYRFFLDFSDIASPRTFAQVWYAMTSFGHDAVMAFFVLSGFLVGSSALRDIEKGRFSWRRYLVSRGVRLYLVLIPGLLLTWVFDRVGLAWFAQNAVYTGAPQDYRHDFFNVALRATPETLAGNAVFLQRILVEPFGSNDALWSLSFEFWYYIAFPLVAFAFVARTPIGWRIAAAAFAIAVLYGVGSVIATYFTLWLLGIGVAHLPRMPALSRRASLGLALSGPIALTVVALLHTTRAKTMFHHSLFAMDTVTALVCAAWLYVMLHDTRPSTSNLYGRVAALLAGCSYTLYVVHLPVLVLLRAWLVGDHPWVPDALFVSAALGIGVLVLGFALVVARLTESHTEAVRRRILSKWSRV
jgi:peptidoglycan/LPS O-acetylase OafA/YrhL